MKKWVYISIRNKTLSSKVVVEYNDGREEIFESYLKALNTLGEQGWEICGIAQTNPDLGLHGLIFLKR